MFLKRPRFKQRTLLLILLLPATLWLLKSRLEQPNEWTNLRDQEIPRTDPGYVKVEEPTLAIIITATLDNFTTQFPYYSVSSILNGTKVPDEIVVVVSDSGGLNDTADHVSAVQTFQERIKSHWGVEKSSLVRVLVTMTPSTGGALRNVGVGLVKSDLVSFFDINDIAHPQRVETLKRIFQSHSNLEGLLHGFRAFKDKATYYETKFEDYSNMNISDVFDYHWDIYRVSYSVFYKVNFIDRGYDSRHAKTVCCDLVDKSIAVQNSWITVRASVLKDIQFDASLDHAFDVKFFMKALYLGKNMTSASRFILGKRNDMPDRQECFLDDPASDPTP